MSAVDQTFMFVQGITGRQLAGLMQLVVPQLTLLDNPRYIQSTRHNSDSMISIGAYAASLHQGLRLHNDRTGIYFGLDETYVSLTVSAGWWEPNKQGNLFYYTTPTELLLQQFAPLFEAASNEAQRTGTFPEYVEPNARYGSPSGHLQYLTTAN